MDGVVSPVNDGDNRMELLNAINVHELLEEVTSKEETLPLFITEKERSYRRE